MRVKFPATNPNGYPADEPETADEPPEVAVGTLKPSRLVGRMATFCDFHRPPSPWLGFSSNERDAGTEPSTAFPMLFRQ